MSICGDRARSIKEPLLKIANDPKLSAEEKAQAIRDTINRSYRIPTLDAETAQEVRSIASRAQGLSGIDKQIALHQMMSKIGEQIPVSIGSKVAAIYTTEQLANPKTVIKFFIGHNLFPAGELAAQTVASGIDAVRSAITGGARTTTLPDLTAYMRGLVRGWGYGVKAAKAGVSASPQTLLEVPPVFRGWLGKAVRGSHAFFEGAARGVYEAGFETSLSEQMRVAKMNGLNLSRPTAAMLEKAAAVGEYFALQDQTTAAKAAARIKRGLNLGQDFGLGNLVLNYPKIQGNLLSRGLEFSPLGLIRSIYEAAAPAFGKDRVDTKTFTTHLSRALVGAPAAVAIFALAKAGIVRDQGPASFKAQAQEEEEGRRKYQVNISALKRYFLSSFDPKEAEARPGDQLATYDWLEPSATNANLAAAAARKSPEGVAEALSGSLETLSEAPVLKSLRDATSNREGLGGALKNIAKDLPSDFVPTAVKQVRRFTDETKRDTTTTKAEDPYGIKESFNRLRNQVPGLSKSLPARIGPFGEEQTYQQSGASTPRKLANTFFSPAQLSTYQPTKESQYALTLESELGEKGGDKYLPAPAPREVKIKDQYGQEQERELTAKEREAYQRYVGPLQQQLYSTAATSNEFQLLPPKEQARQVEQYQNRISEAAKAAVLGDRRPGYTRTLEAPIPQNKEFFEHNARVEAAKQETLEAFKTDENWKQLYNQLSSAQQEYAIRQVDALYARAKVKETPNMNPYQQKFQLQGAQQALSGIYPGRISQILYAARFRSPETRR